MTQNISNVGVEPMGLLSMYLFAVHPLVFSPLRQNEAGAYRDRGKLSELMQRTEVQSTN